MRPLRSHRTCNPGDLKMTREETKRDVHHLYGHWRRRMASRDSCSKALLFYNWLRSIDTGILSFGAFGPGAIHKHIAVWVEEWEKGPVAHRIEH
jgi:hypothetical protein